MSIGNIHDIITDASRVLREEAQALYDAAQRLQSNPTSRDGYEQAIYYMFRALDAGGKIVVTGVGKSGKIGEKIVATMLSTGTCATFLHPVEALHGDLGAIQPQDVVLALSYSGNTEELLLLLPSLKRRNVPVIGMGGNANSKLARECVAWLDGGVAQEVGGREIPAPTTSTTLALALGDAVALTLAKLRFFTTDGFAMNHPGGSLGRRLLLKVEDCAVPVDKVATVSPKDSLDIVIMKMTQHPKGAGVVVLNDEYPFSPPSPPCSSASSTDEEMTQDGTSRDILGVITHDDIHNILKSKREGIFHIRALDIMKDDPEVCSVDELAADAMRKMIDQDKVPFLPVVDKDKQWKGVVTLKDLQELF
ncbi:hypothetical protein EC973_005450 [Apophysomyces ossiformis]|uniref:Uncharacterized protein n=1 Tax=Apophysomyces ossiformis TaxID=679940 RepID=A0A8H7BW77_9FUNG|nr:hypothetical protein EC973_005450 [Apophysomyces ossiformis]